MKRDPTDEKYRKPRQLRNTALQKFIRNASLITTGVFAIAMYIGYKRQIAPYVDKGRSKEDFGMQNPDLLLNEPIYVEVLFNKLLNVWKKEAVSATTKNNIQTDK